MGFDRVYPVYYEISFELEIEFKTGLIINWIYPIKTHSRETWGKSRWPIVALFATAPGWILINI
jgi:hypothetical protein